MRPLEEGGEGPRHLALQLVCRGRTRVLPVAWEKAPASRCMKTARSLQTGMRRRGTLIWAPGSDSVGGWLLVTHSGDSRHQEIRKRHGSSCPSLSFLLLVCRRPLTRRSTGHPAAKTSVLRLL